MNTLVTLERTTLEKAAFVAGVSYTGMKNIIGPITVGLTVMSSIQFLKDYQYYKSRNAQQNFDPRYIKDLLIYWSTIRINPQLIDKTTPKDALAYGAMLLIGNFFNAVSPTKNLWRTGIKNRRSRQRNPWIYHDSETPTQDFNVETGFNEDMPKADPTVIVMDSFRFPFTYEEQLHRFTNKDIQYRDQYEQMPITVSLANFLAKNSLQGWVEENDLGGINLKRLTDEQKAKIYAGEIVPEVRYKSHAVQGLLRKKAFDFYNTSLLRS